MDYLISAISSRGGTSNGSLAPGGLIDTRWLERVSGELMPAHRSASELTHSV